jgi:phosphomannomutase / phosphoglucomutase
VNKYKINAAPNSSIFRAYDIRGIVGDGIDENVLYTIGLALAVKIKKTENLRVAVGRDGRISSPKLCDALITGLLDSGCDVVDVGEVPSPALYFATHHLDVGSGLMLTGSHNPKNYNGLKMTVGGKTLTEAEILDLYAAIIKSKFQLGKVGKLTAFDILLPYREEIKNRVNLKRPLKVVIDCGNGVAGNIAPDVFADLGCDLIKLYCDVDGNFPNHHPNPSVAENLTDLIAAVKLHDADVGLAFDGDADRLGVVTNLGKIIWPDRLMMLYSKDLLSRDPGAKVVFDVKCSSFLSDVVTKFGGKPILWRTGHSVLKAKMIEEEAALAGEMSGHIFFRENWYGFDDGIYSGARLLQILSLSDKSIHDIFLDLPEGKNTPEILIPIADSEKFVFMEQLLNKAQFKDASINKIDGLRVTFSHGWGLVRASNTTPALTLRFESSTELGMLDIQSEICDLLLDVDPKLDLSAIEGYARA